MQFLKADTAVTLKIGPFLDETDGKTAETGLTIAQADVRLSKNGGDIAQKNESTSCTHDELGIYGCPINATDTNTLGRLQLWVHESGALPVWHEFMVVPANVWDSFFGADMLKVDVHSIDDDETAANNLEFYCDGSTLQPVNVFQISGDATAANNLEADYDGTGYVGGTIVKKADVTKVGGVAQSATDLKDFADTGYDSSTHKVQGVVLADTVTALTGHTVQTGDGYAIVNSGTHGNAALKALIDTLDTVADGIKAVTDNLPNSGALSDLATILTDTGELQTDLVNGGRLDLLIDAIKAVTDALPNSGALSDLAAILTDTGTTLPATLATIAAYIDAEVAAILTDTGTTLPATLATIAGYLDTEIAAIKAKTDLRPSGIPKNVALSNLTFLMTETDYKTPATGKTVTGQISKDGDAFANLTNSVSEIAGGFYKVDITQTEMNADMIALKFTATGCAQRSIIFPTST